MDEREERDRQTKQREEKTKYRVRERGTVCVCPNIRVSTIAGLRDEKKIKEVSQT